MPPKATAVSRRKSPAKASSAEQPTLARPTIEEARQLLLPYQRDWVEDNCRFLAGVWGRQTGKSFATAHIIACSMAAHADTQWMIAAPSERQSLEALDKVKQWLRALKLLFAEHVEALQDVNEKAAVVTLGNGSRVMAVPGKPATVRGMSANVWLDEFAFFEAPDATWMAILPSITNPLRGGEKRVIITSTPNGKAGQGKRFYDICTGRNTNKDMRWSVHKVALRRAIAAGLPVDYNTLAAAMNDPLAVAQELDAEFTDAGGQLLPTDIILRAESDAATLATTAETYSGHRDIRLGIDIGRVSDPTVLWAVERLGDILITREVMVLAGLSHADQLPLIASRVRGSTRVCIDYTGLGIGLGDMLVREYGQYKPEAHQFGRVELCTFSASLKQQIFPRLRDAMEGGRLRIPRDETLRSDLAAMHQVVQAGGYSYEAPRTRDGHSDRCTAVALAVRAASGPTNSNHIGVLGLIPLAGARPYGGQSGRTLAARRITLATLASGVSTLLNH